MASGLVEMSMDCVGSADPEVAALIAAEEQRQRLHIDLIAAENHASRTVLQAQGSLLTNKYAEGYPHARYYGSCLNIDRIEELAIARAQELFAAEHANVQAHSGTQANMAAYLALLQQGDTVLAMSLAHGGHLSHGSPASFSGVFYRFICYTVDRETELLDYDQVERLAVEHRPKLIVAGASSYPRSIDFARFGRIAQRVGAKLMVDMAHVAGLVAAGVHPSPIPHAQVVTSSTHKTLRGPRGGFILCQADWATAIDRSIFPGTQGGPLMHVIAAKAVAFAEAMRPEFVSYQRKVLENATALGEGLRSRGLRLVSGGTENHLLVVDLTATGITGRAAEEALDRVGLTVNRNAIPFDPRPPQTASGIRLGTPAVTTRGFGPGEMETLAELIVRVLSHPDDEGVMREVRGEVEDLSRRFPLTGVDT